MFRCNLNYPNFDLFKFVGEMNLHISKLRKKNVVKSVIHKIVKDSEKNGCSDKIERIKTICQKHFTKLQRMKNTQK